MQDKWHGHTNDLSEMRPAYTVVGMWRHPRQAMVTLHIDICWYMANRRLTSCGWRSIPAGLTAISGPADRNVGVRREPMDDIFRRLDEHHQKHRVSHWAGTFRDYLPIALKNPQLAQLAHARVYNMVRSYGVDIDEHGNES